MQREALVLGQFQSKGLYHMLCFPILYFGGVECEDLHLPLLDLSYDEMQTEQGPYWQHATNTDDDVNVNSRMRPPALPPYDMHPFCKCNDSTVYLSCSNCVCPFFFFYIFVIKSRGLASRRFDAYVI